MTKNEFKEKIKRFFIYGDFNIELNEREEEDCFLIHDLTNDFVILDHGKYVQIADKFIFTEMNYRAVTNVSLVHNGDKSIIITVDTKSTRTYFHLEKTDRVMFTY